MKARNVLTIGMITCSTVLNAQISDTNALSENQLNSAASTVIYRETLWTNGVFIPSTNERVLTEAESDIIEGLRSGGTNRSAKASEYRIIVLDRNAAMADAIDREEEANTTDADTNRTFSAEELRYWKYGIKDSNQSGQTGKKQTQVIIIEPQNASAGIVPDSIRLREYMFVADGDASEEYPWFDPRLIISMYKELWMNEADVDTDGAELDMRDASEGFFMKSDVVLVLIKF